ncbi:protein Opi10p [Monosporozyma unispora]|nr:Protein opi10 [Kazachstania unispora]
MFAAIASGNPLQLSEEVPSSNGLQHTLVLSSTKPKNYSHITLFILPNVTFPADFVAIVYFKLGQDEDFKLFGYLSLEKPSAIFKVKLPGMSIPVTNNEEDEGLGEIDMDGDGIGNNNNTNNINMSNLSQLIIGISIEPRAEGMNRLAEWRELRAANFANNNNNSMALTRGVRGITTAGQLAKMYPKLTQDLAAKIVQHAYNYLSGFLDMNGNVSIKRFDTWWDKFKKRLANDGTFLDEVTRE